MISSRMVGDKNKKKKSKNGVNKPEVEIEKEQAVINVFVEAFSDTILNQGSNNLNSTIQRIKGDLYDRNYKAAFELSSSQDLACYAARWSPSRALSYRQLIKDLIPDYLGKDLFHHEDDDLARENNILCIGGGACGEIVAISKLANEESSKCRIHIDIVDIADWTQVIEKMKCKMNINLCNLDIKFHKFDILSQDDGKRIKPYNEYTLITIMFTTNELFASNKQRAINKIREISQGKPKYILICESAGSFSDIQIGNKKFPLQFLIDYTFCGGGINCNNNNNNNDATFKIVSKSDSQWYRRPSGLNYPLQLEDMRYFYRLYKLK